MNELVNSLSDTGWVNNTVKHTHNEHIYTIAMLVLLLLFMAMLIHATSDALDINYFKSLNIIEKLIISAIWLGTICTIISIAYYSYLEFNIEDYERHTYEFVTDESEFVTYCNISNVDPVKSLESLYILIEKEDLNFKNRLDIEVVKSKVTE